MRQRTLLYKLLVPVLFIAFAAMIAVMVYSAGTMRRFHIGERKTQLGRLLSLFESDIYSALSREDYDLLDQLCRDIAARFETRVTVVGSDGAVLSDTHEDPAEMDNHLTRPEIIQAAGEGAGSDLRYSVTLGAEMLYVAAPFGRRDPVPHTDDPHRSGFIRMAVPLSAINDALRTLYGRLMVGGTAAALLIALVSYATARSIALPLKNLIHGARRFAEGRLNHKIQAAGIVEMDNLAAAMNLMAAQLDQRFRKIQEQKKELDAILSSMGEGIVAIDTGGRILSINRRAGEILDIDAEKAAGKRLTDIVRNSDFSDLVRAALTETPPAEKEIVLRDRGNNEIHLAVRGTTLNAPDAAAGGAVIVLEDHTHIRKLERIRSDFVANVSHELRTPITSIIGFVETLQNEGDASPEKRRRFLEIMARQAKRMSAIINDLLTLSSIEKGPAARREICSICNVLENAVNTCRYAAEEKEISLKLECEEDIEASVIPQLLEQAVVNLIQNAVKYSPEGETVRIAAAWQKDRLLIKVIDKGCGIEEKHIDRLFERFYRVDKARSRELGGTGLGLAIVKHIVQAHGGSIEVESAPGKGSTFTIHLPA